MYHEYFIQKGVLLLPIIAMLAFVATFVAVVLATYRSQKRAEFDHMSQLPLGEDGEVKIDSQLVSASHKSVQGV
ncbi:MAG: cbb3-type cytochrome c oxidase subunit 3 [Polyangia bacterium]|jgi:cbb3-type cytochrome oxidase subunit 3